LLSRETSSIYLLFHLDFFGCWWFWKRGRRIFEGLISEKRKVLSIISRAVQKEKKMPEEVAHEWPVHIREIVIPKKRKPETFLSSLGLFGLKKGKCSYSVSSHRIGTLVSVWVVVDVPMFPTIARLPMSVSSPRPVLRINGTNAISEGVTPVMQLPIPDNGSDSDSDDEDAIHSNEAVSIHLPLLRNALAGQSLNFILPLLMLDPYGFACATEEPLSESDDDSSSDSDIDSEQESDWRRIRARFQAPELKPLRSLTTITSNINEEEKKLDNNVNGEDEKEDEEEDEDEEEEQEAEEQEDEEEDGFVTIGAPGSGQLRAFRFLPFITRASDHSGKQEYCCHTRRIRTVGTDFLNRSGRLRE